MSEGEEVLIGSLGSKEREAGLRMLSGDFFF